MIFRAVDVDDLPSGRGRTVLHDGIRGGGPDFRDLALRRGNLVGAGTIDPADAERVTVTDSVAAAVALIRDASLCDFGLTYGPRARPRWYLGEK
jgi:hypothetical protein